MKKTLLLGLGACALALGGVAASINSDPVETDAFAGVDLSGSITVDITKRAGWSEASFKAAAHFFFKYYDEGDVVSNTGWSSLVSVEKDATSFTIPYSHLDFYPSHMIIVRYNSELPDETWETGDKWDAGWKWNQTGDLFFGPEVSFTGNDDASTQNLTFPGLHGTKNSWSKESWGILPNKKTNGEGHTEFYGDVTLSKDEKFKVAANTNGWEQNYYGNGKCTINSLLDSGTFSYDGDANVQCNVAGTYSIYFDTVNNSFYITTPEYVEADEYAQDFLDAFQCGGDTGEHGLPAGTNNVTNVIWNDLKTGYNALSEDARDLLTETPSVADADNYLQKALYRYDYMLFYKHYSFEDFMKRDSSEGKFSFSNLVTESSIVNNEDSNATLLISSAVIVSTIALGGLFLLRKKRAE